MHRNTGTHHHGKKEHKNKKKKKNSDQQHSDDDKRNKRHRKAEIVTDAHQQDSDNADDQDSYKPPTEKVAVIKEVNFGFVSGVNLLTVGLCFGFFSDRQL